MEKKVQDKMHSPNSHNQLKEINQQVLLQMQNKNNSNHKRKRNIKSDTHPHHLSNIVELTQQNQPQGATVIMQTIKNIPQTHKLSEKNQQNLKKINNSIFNFFTNFFKKGLNCLEFTYAKFYNKASSEQIDIQQSQISEILSKLRRKKSRKINLLPQLPLQHLKKRTLVLDLDQTLIHTTHKKPQTYDFKIKIMVNNSVMLLYVVKRFGLDSFLFQMSKMYELVIFSSSKNDFVEKIMDQLDPKKKISHVLSRQHCIVINRCYYIKSVRDLGRDPRNVIMVDSHPISASLNPENLYRIDNFRGSSKDRKLLKLGYFLKYLNQRKDITQVTPIQMLRRQFESKQIRISEKQNKQNTYKKRDAVKKKQSVQLNSLLTEKESSQNIFNKH